MNIATVVLLTDIFKSADIISIKACYFIPILQASVVSAFCFFTICTIKNIYQKQTPHIFSIYLQMSNENFQIN